MSENACGKASSDSTANGKDSSVECPTCGREFDTKAGMRYHHATIHGESIAKTTNDCVNCGDSYEVRKSRRDKSRFCSTDCKYEYQEESQTGENNPNWGGGEDTNTCEYCEGDYQIVPARADKSRFCSMECFHDWQSENWTGENHHMWTERETITCDTCGTDFGEIPSHTEKRRFCSQDCWAVWHSDFISGENHPNWKEEVTPEYGPNWEEQAEKCRERDGHECQICGLSQDEHWRKLAAHHITPRSEFVDKTGDYDYKRGNRLDNLVTLCSSCHHKYEGWPVLPLS